MGGQRITGLAEPIVSSDAATKNYADTITAAFFSTGDMKPTLKTVPDSGWIMMFDQTIGNAGSGAVSGGPQMLALFTLIWNNISAPSGNTLAPVSGGLGASAAADWAGLKVLTLPLSVGRVIGNSANGGTTGLTQRILGRSVGAETAALSTANLPPYTPAGTITNGAITSTTPQAGGTASTTMAGTTTSSIVGATSIIITSTQAASTFTGSPQGGTSAAFQIMQPSLFVNWMIKL
jgi:microcystin-dependent protein